MEPNINKLLNEEIKARLLELQNLKVGTDEMASAVHDLKSLYELQITESKNDWEFQEKYETRSNEEKFRKEQLTVQIIDNVCKLAVQTAGIIIPVMFYTKWMKEGFNFEETGVYTSSTFRNLWGHFRPEK